MLGKLMPAVVGTVGMAAYAGHLTYATLSIPLGLIVAATAALCAYGFWQDIREDGGR